MLKQDTGKLLRGVTSRNLVKIFFKFFSVSRLYIFFSGVYTFLYKKRTIKRGGQRKLKEVRGDRRKKGVTHVLWPMRKFASSFFFKQYYTS